MGGQSGAGAILGAGGTRARTGTWSAGRVVLLAPRLLAFSVSLLLLPGGKHQRGELQVRSPAAIGIPLGAQAEALQDGGHRGTGLLCSGNSI